ncbi:glycosyltransferase family 4 protein [candidate division WWE3 bacterium]|uniref:Glycosyltransferase family 4 protein n=1 Tax=candidate division WWE3 bacterium TaxID=2053526 RepID=A0A7X9HSM6_UNCKA|nr:glycosyltransferase family 4 protein [candidate division WWE3 bacterium]
MKGMKVLMLGRIGLMKARGGDRIQVENTASELRKLGVDVDIKTNMKFNPWEYDLVHIFQLDWTPETYLYAKKVKKYNKPIVLSPIHHSVEEVKKFDDEFVFDFRRLSKVLFKDQFRRDTFKNIYRSFFNPRMIVPTLYSIFIGFKNMQKRTLNMVDVVLVQTVKEAEDLKKTFNVDFKWHKVLNGVGKAFIDSKEYKNKFSFEDYIICVGRIEPRKNQLSVIEAVKRFREEEKKDVQLVLIGQMSLIKHFEFNYLIKKCFKKYRWIHHVNGVSYSDMPSYYHFAKVCVSASWFETTGLTSLEALYCGTNSVAAGLRAKEYLGGYASFCKPDDVNSIKDAIKKEYYASRPVINDKIKEEYTWSNAAKKTFEVYNEVLKM